MENTHHLPAPHKKPSAAKKDSLAGSSFTRFRQPSETVQKKCSPYHLCIPNCIRIISALKYLQRCSAKTISLTTSNTSFSLRTVYIHAIIAVMITLRSSTNQSHLLFLLSSLSSAVGSHANHFLLWKNTLNQLNIITGDGRGGCDEHR